MSDSATPAIDQMLQRVAAQPVLFAARLSRLSLLGLELPEASLSRLSINVWRNHAIESVLGLAQPFFRFGRIAADVRTGAYDDSLGFTGHAPADVELLWLDSTRHLACGNLTDWLTWLRGRLGALRSQSVAPIVVATWTPDAQGTTQLQALVDEHPGVYFADLRSTCEAAGEKLLDLRSAGMAGTPLGNGAQALLARKLACHWLPGAALPPIKALALDLDETLHAGVLGEDGATGVRLTPGHAALQTFVREQSRRGVFLALVSRNEAQDVQELFAQRVDYALRLEDFSVQKVSWGSKAVAIEQVARDLRIGLDAVLYVDDNAGELAHVTAALPQVHTVHADEDAALTQRAITWYPGLWRWRTSEEDAKRVQDLMANAQREALQQQSIDPAAYVRSLRIALTIRHGARVELPRAGDLCRKTNQFNLALRRLTDADLAARAGSPNAGIATIQMQDRLADSGVIAVIVAVREGTRLRVEELCISCRAMGRGLEETMVLLALRSMPAFEGCSDVVFDTRHGPRNQPALDWLAALLGRPSPLEEGAHAYDAGRIRAFRADETLTLTYES